MNSLGLGFWTTGIAASCFLAAGGAPQAPTQTNEGRLIRIAPRPSAPQAGAGQDDASDRVPVERFQDWSSRLTSDDLDERERAFDEIVAAARRNQDLRDTLAEWSRDDSQRDLAWSARLALRELRTFDAQGQGWFALPGFGGRFGNDPSGLGGFELHGFDPGAWPDPQTYFDRFRRFDELQPPSADTQSEFESVSLQVTDEGVTCKVTRRVDGQDVTEEYKASSLEELLEAHPELKGRLTIRFADPFRGDASRWFQRFPTPMGGTIAPTVRTDVLGVVVVPLSPEESKSLSLEPGHGLRIDRVEPGTIAAQLGLQRGHVLVEIDGQPIRTREDITSRLTSRPPDGPLEIKLIDRWGQERKRVWKPDAAKRI